MKFKNRLKRVADILEKIGVAGLALGIFQNSSSGTGWAFFFLLISIYLTKED